MNSRAQAAMEYLMITGFVFLIMLPLVYLVYNYTEESSADIIVAQLNKIGREMVTSAESVYYFSNPSKITLDINMPEAVLNMSIVTNNFTETRCNKCTELRFLVQTADHKSTLVFSSKIELRGENYYNDTYPYVSVFNRSDFSQGIKHFLIEAHSDHVLITTE